MLLEDLSTPCLLIDSARLERNIRRMQGKAAGWGVRLRPHAKTHKSVAIAQMQEEAGAHGITVAKPSEAEVFVEAGFEDVRIAYTVYGEDKWSRIARMMNTARISFCVDTFEGARAASAFFVSRDLEASILMEVDTGHHRCGVDPDRRESFELAREIRRLPGLRLVGILTHAGHGYRGPNEGEAPEAALRRVAAEERDRMLLFAERLYASGDEGVRPGSFEISIGSTPTMSAFENDDRSDFRVTEIRPGNYVFNDAIQVGLGVAELADCSLTVLSTVVSKHRDRTGRERVLIDAGKKVLTSDTGSGTDGYGVIIFNANTMTPLPHARISSLSEEHGWVDVPGGATLEVGSRVRIVPNHACVVAGMADRFFLVEKDRVEDELRVNARGKVE